MTTHELIERYVGNVRNRLPRKFRRDVPLELESLIADALEARQPIEDEEAAVIEVLKEMGSPDELAAQYRPKQQLIGPELFPLYKLVLTIVLSVLTIVILAANLITVFSDGTLTEFLQRVPRLIVDFAFDELIQVVGYVTIVFAILQWFGVAENPLKQDNWDPRKLPKVEDSERFKRGDVTLSLVFSTLMLIALNYFGRRAAFFTFGDGTALGFTENLRVLLPWISAILVTEIVMYWQVLRKQRWQLVTRATELIANVADLVLLYVLTNSRPILTQPLFDTLLSFIFAIVAVIVVIDTIVKTYRFFNRYVINRQPELEQMRAV